MRRQAAHLGDEQLAALVEAGAAGDAEPALLEHLATCETCRSEWVALHRALRDAGEEIAPVEAPWPIERATMRAGGASRAASRPMRVLWRWLPLPALAAALVLALSGVALLGPWDLPGRDGALRSAASPDDAVPLAPLAPLGSAPAGAPLEFRWVPLDGATAYELVILDAESGATIVTHRVVEARAALTSEDRARLGAGRSYRWIVRAERGVGRVTTGPPAVLRLTDR